MPHALHVPDRAICEQLRRLDPDLSIAWDDLTERWMVLHGLQVPGNLEETADLLAREMQERLSAGGYTRDYHECQAVAWDQLRTCKLVCYVTEDDGSYRPLDGRIVQKLERMKWQMENLGLQGMQALCRIKADAMQARREREADDLWASIRRDKVFARVVSDVIWGVRPLRSVDVPEGISDATGVCDEDGDPVGGACPAGDGAGGDAVSSEDAAPQPG